MAQGCGVCELLGLVREKLKEYDSSTCHRYPKCVCLEVLEELLEELC